MALAIRTGIAPSVWADEGLRAIETAVALLNEQDQPERSNEIDLSQFREV